MTGVRKLGSGKEIYRSYVSARLGKGKSLSQSSP